MLPFCCLLLAVVVQTPYVEVKPILEALAEILPAELKRSGAESNWPTWAAREDAAIRSRLQRGDEDTLVNFLLLGTSFTSQPRCMDPNQPMSVLRARLEDLVRALAKPGANERLQWLRQVAIERGQDPDTEAGRQRLRQYLIENLARARKEQQSFMQALSAARKLGDATEEFAERSRLYSARGLSLDTSLKPNFGIEQTLRQLQARGLLTAVRRAAVIGPGMDFADKLAGYDFYPPQSIQPFALIDTLLRLGLSRAEALEVTTVDISPRLNAHLRRARAEGLRSAGYTIELPRDPQAQWTPQTVEYWRQFGDKIGSSERPVSPPKELGGLALRAVKVRSGIVAKVSPADLDVVVQRLDGESFDLVIATNVLVYYGTLQQSLALSNIGYMLRPGGFLLSNNALLELPATSMHSAGYTTVVYSSMPDDGDQFVWYQRAAK